MTKGQYLFQQMQKVKMYRSRYFINKNGVVMLNWAGGWKSYDFVAARDKRYVIEEFQTEGNT